VKGVGSRRLAPATVARAVLGNVCNKPLLVLFGERKVKVLVDPLDGPDRVLAQVLYPTGQEVKKKYKNKK